MAAIYALVPVIADVIDAHCRGSKARETFVSACLNGHWDEAGAMIEGMLAEPWHLRGHQEERLRDFQELLQLRQGSVTTEQHRAG
jgi:hypothetical protein